jgi:uncharacterized protein YjbI with pentapeptide repeats
LPDDVFFVSLVRVAVWIDRKLTHYLTRVGDDVQPRAGALDEKSDATLFRLYRASEGGGFLNAYVLRTPPLDQTDPRGERGVSFTRTGDFFDGKLAADRKDATCIRLSKIEASALPFISYLKFGESFITVSNNRLKEDNRSAPVWEIRELVKSPDFRNADLRHADLRVPRSTLPYQVVFRRGEDFSGAQLSRANLSDTTFENCKFEEAKLIAADCRNTRFEGEWGGNMKRAVLEGAKLDGAQLRGVDFSGAKLTQANFGNADVTGAILDHAKANAADLRNVRFDSNRRPRFHSPEATPGTEPTILWGAKLKASLLGLDWSFLDLSAATIEDVPHDLGAIQAKYSKLWPGAFAGKRLANSDFTGSDIANVDFTGAILAGAKFSGQNLVAVKLDRADLTGADLTDASLRGKTLTGAILTRAKMIRTDCGGARLASCVVTEAATFSTDPRRRTIFEKAEFPPALLGLNWEALDLRGLPESVHFPEDLTNLNAKYALLHGINLSGRILDSAEFQHAELRGASLADCDLSSAKFNHASLQGGDGKNACDLGGAYLKTTDFEDANLTGVTATYCYLYENAKMARATLVDCDFSNSYMTGANFEGIAGNAMRGVKFTGACLVNAKFKGVLFSNYNDAACSLVKALLHGADFTGATLTGVFMREAAVARAAGSVPVRYPTAYHGVMRDRTVAHQATVINAAAATSSTTVCPAGGNGPCDGNKLYSEKAPGSWPVPVSRDETESE